MADARIARVSTRVIIRPTTVAQVARTSIRTLTSNTPLVAIQIAQTSLRVLSSTPSIAQMARISIRAITSIVGIGLFVQVWDGAAWVDAPVQVWDGAAFVDPSALKIWNGSAWV